MMFDNYVGRNTTSLVFWLLTCMGPREAIASVVDGRRTVAGELKETGQRMLIAHTGTHRFYAESWMSRVNAPV